LAGCALRPSWLLRPRSRPTTSVRTSRTSSRSRTYPALAAGDDKGGPESPPCAETDMDSARVRGRASVRLPARPSVRRVRQQRNLPGPLDGHGQLALVPGAVAGDAPRQHLGPLGQEAAQAAGFLIIDAVDFVDAERANLSSAPPFPPHKHSSHPANRRPRTEASAAARLKGNFVFFKARERIGRRARAFGRAVFRPIQKAHV